MDIILEIADNHLGLDWVYNKTYDLPRDNIYRQSISLFFVWWFGGMLAYLGTATVAYVLWFDKNTFNHPRYIELF